MLPLLRVTRNALRTQMVLPWSTLFGLSVLLWIPTWEQAWHMWSLHLPQIGTMGLALGPFLVYWTLMMGAMMLPALTPTAALRYQTVTRQTSTRQAWLGLLLFVLAYLLPWTLFGVIAFLLADLGQYWARYAPTSALGLGVALLVLSGCYQMTPFKTRFLTRCNPSLCCAFTPDTPRTLYRQLGDGLFHGLECLGCCGPLMLVMVAVGLMSLPWMLLLTLVIFCEKTWSKGARFGFFVGFALLVFAALALAEPALLSGVIGPLGTGF